MAYQLPTQVTQRVDYQVFDVDELTLAAGFFEVIAAVYPEYQDHEVIARVTRLVYDKYAPDESSLDT